MFFTDPRWYLNKNLLDGGRFYSYKNCLKQRIDTDNLLVSECEADSSKTPLSRIPTVLKTNISKKNAFKCLITIFRLGMWTYDQSAMPNSNIITSASSNCSSLAEISFLQAFLAPLAISITWNRILFSKKDCKNRNT